MCLITCIKKPFVAKEDIIVYKYIEVTESGKYITPIMGYPIELNSTIKASEKGEKITFATGNKFGIEKGAIHAYAIYSDLSYFGYVCFKAIIKKGTEFWISNNSQEIAARELYITDERIEINEHQDIEDVWSMKIAQYIAHIKGKKIND